MMVRIGSLIIGLFVSTGVYAEPETSIQTRGYFSPQNIPLNIISESDLPGATYTVFYRVPIAGQSMSGWNAASELAGVEATSAVFAGEHKHRYEFRSSASVAEGEEMTAVADFDIPEELDRVWIKSMIPDFQLTVKHGMDLAIQGNGCWIGQFAYDKEQFPGDLSSEALFAAVFTNSTPVRDWSPYRYLEFYYYSDTPSLDLYIKSASQEIKAPVLRFTEFFDEGPDGWYSILVDLDQYLGKPEDRKTIDSFALITPVEKLKPQHLYTIRLDGVRLWQTRHFASTTVDETPPTAPEDIHYELNGENIIWTWKPCQDDESGIEGYTFLFTQDRRIPIPMEIRTKEPMVSIPFSHPQLFERWYFIVFACNNAGVWSAKNTQSVDFIPGKTDR